MEETGASDHAALCPGFCFAVGFLLVQQRKGKSPGLKAILTEVGVRELQSNACTLEPAE